MYCPLPRMKRGSSLRFIEWPIPLTSAVVVGACASVIVVSSGAQADAAAVSGSASAALSSAAACWTAFTMFR